MTSVCTIIGYLRTYYKFYNYLNYLITSTLLFLILNIMYMQKRNARNPKGLPPVTPVTRNSKTLPDISFMALRATVTPSNAKRLHSWLEGNISPIVLVLYYRLNALKSLLRQVQ